MTLQLPEPRITPLRGGATLRWGVLAPGTIANSWVSTVHANTDQRVVAVASRNPERAQAFATQHGIDRAYGDYEQLVADPEVQIVYIAAPHSEHARLALMALAAGKHILVEKPIGVSAAEARQIADAAAAAGLFAAEAMWSRYLPQTSIIDQLLTETALGDVLTVTADFSAVFDYDPTSRAFDPALGGGAMLDIGVYPGWFSHFVLGAPRTVTAVGTLAQTGVEDHVAVILGHHGGAQSVLTTSMLADGPLAATIVGRRGRIEVDGPFFGPSSLRLIVGDETAEWVDETRWSWGEGLCYQATAAAHYVSEGLLHSPVHSLTDTIEVLEMVDEVRRQLGAA